MRLFATAIFINAALLFLLEPMFGKSVLPYLGGGAAVWTTCMLFYQAALLVGYLYAHALAAFVPPRAQRVVHLALLVAAALTLPVVIPRGWSPASVADPVPSLTLLMARHVGPAFVLLAAGSPLLMAWSARGRSAYRLYAASNLGSMLALLAYPLLVEPTLGLRAQSIAWSIGYIVLIAAIGVSALQRSDQHLEVIKGSQIAMGDRLRWVALAAAPSSLLLGVTTHVTTDVAPVPLLWVIPLALYLLTFVIAFDQDDSPVQRIGRVVLPYAVLAVAVLLCLQSELPGVWGPVPHLLAFFVVALGCHSTLATRRPVPSRLTEFYFWVALGGVLGGVFNAIAAPLIFTTVVEYPIAFVAAIALGSLAPAVNGRDALRHPIVLAAAATGIIGIGAALVQFGGRTILTARSFYGVYRVVDDSAAGVRRFYSGNTVHGSERLGELAGQDPAPLAYYHHDGPLGSIFATRDRTGGTWRVEAIGLGVGAAAAYARAGEAWTFYELDPLVATIAGADHDFTFLSSAASHPSLVLGDGRLSLSIAAPARDNLIIVDAFSSDAVPVHLLTREALALYRSRLAPDGIIAWHVSNKYLALWRVLQALAADAHLVALVNTDINVPNDSSGRLPSIWVAMTASPDQADRLRVDPRWHPLVTPKPVLWTDDLSNVASILR